ncbi:MAG: peptide chain release factor-like protein [Bacteroidetes bacterium]|nr:peptide chain release factor-like protein [Bacteroidota bacterium]
MSKFGVTQKKEEELYASMNSLSIFEEDIEEKFIKSSGKGGQNVNKNSTCVQLKHLPSGIIVKYQKERTQNLNRFFARRSLIEKMDELVNKDSSKKNQIKSKIAKQKSRRKRRTRKKLDTNL